MINSLLLYTIISLHSSALSLFDSEFHTLCCQEGRLGVCMCGGSVYWADGLTNNYDAYNLSMGNREQARSDNFERMLS